MLVKVCLAQVWWFARSSSRKEPVECIFNFFLKFLKKSEKNGGGAGVIRVMGYDTLMLKLDIFWQLFFLKMNLLHISMKYKPVMRHPANGPPDRFRNRGKVLKHTISFRLFGEVALIHAFSRAKCYILAFRFPKRWFTIVQWVVFQHAKQLWAFWLLQTDIIERIQDMSAMAILTNKQYTGINSSLAWA